MPEPAQTPPALPSLTGFGAVLFDLDGVLTPTADIHRYAWRVMWTELFSTEGVSPPFSDEDYFAHLDGKRRDDGVASVLASRGIVLPAGQPDDPPTARTISGVGNRKNDVFSRILEREGIAPYPGSLTLVDELRREGLPMAVVSSSKNAVRVLTAARLADRFPVVVDGVVAAERHLASKPAPDMFLHAAALMRVPPAAAVVFEDALSGVAAARAGHFGLIVGVDRGAGEAALRAAGADVVVTDLAEFSRPAGPATGAGGAQ